MTARLASANCATDDPTGAKVLAARQTANSMCPLQPVQRTGIAYEETDDD
jgi:hypothetical protein